ncbi:biotin holocarboxylase synthetase [Lunasporangiospora selenospora]|uniref:Biotin holocarboxylase synthetase n=1 Tax=Lunasporangiospora selenospora TaxID=979761 RepID=A0A9P6FZ72_9FUNG|nr:biotin holocarboxylase synthetase [Lunasporangiospora selenospora]
MNILVYAGDGTSRASVIHTVNSLRSLAGQYYDVMKIDAQGLLSEPWEESTSLLVIPGGRDLPYTRDLRGLANDRIRKYIQLGGRFFGICAGGYYGSDRIVFESGSALMEVRGSRELKLFPGECRGAVYPGFVYDSERGARAVGIELNEKALGQEQLGFRQTKVYFNGGGYFVDAEKYEGTQVLAWYMNEFGQIDSQRLTGNSKLKAAMVSCQIGQGLAILTGVHPEYDAAHMDPNNPDYGPEPNVVTKLTERENERRLFLRSVLCKMGINVASVPTLLHSLPAHPSVTGNSSVSESTMSNGFQELPRITPLYLASLHPYNIKKLTATLMGLANGQGIIKGSNDTFQLVPSPLHPIPDQQIDGFEKRTIYDDKGEDDADLLNAVCKSLVLCPDGPPPLTATPEFNIGQYFEALRSARGPNLEYTFGGSLLYGQVVTSTQTMLDKNFDISQQLPSGLVCNATIQVSGRGRGRNSWISPPGCLQFSMTLRYPIASSAFSNVPSVVFIQYLVALAVVESVCSMPGYEDIPLRLKWPNDIYAEAPLTHPSQANAQAQYGASRGKMIKIGGVLVNSNFGGSEFLLVIGCGVNATNPNPTTSINHLIRNHNQVHGTNLAPLSQETLLANILVKFEQFYEQFLYGTSMPPTPTEASNPQWQQQRQGQIGFKSFEEMYYRRWLHSDVAVTLSTLNPPRQVRIKGVTLDYGLLKTVALDDQGREIPGLEYRLQPDGNSFDMLKGLISQKL